MNMTSLERVERAISRQTPDRVPVGPFVGFYAARIAGVSLFQYVTDGRVIADAQYLLWQRLGHDVVVTAADTYYIAEAFGLDLDFPENALPTAKGPVLGSLADAGRLQVPNPRTAGRMPVYLDAVGRLVRRLGDRVAVRGTGTGPFSLAAYLLGPQNLLLKLAEMSCGAATPAEERGFATLMKITTQTVIGFLRAQIDLGVHLAYLGDSLASRDMISPAMYRRYVAPYHKQVFDGVREDCRRRGAHTLLHVCGDNTALLHDFVATGAELYEVDSKIDLPTALRAIGGDVCLIGNLDPAGLLLNGTPEDVRRESKKCIAAARGEGGFILGTGCFVPWDTPLENLQEMVRASRESSNAR
jgi:uroporphyrinogen decarboxylase